MADIYVVMTVALVSWVGIFAYLLRMDLRLKRLEKDHEK